MVYEGYRLIRIEREGAVVTAVVDNPPINLITMELFGELARLSSELEADPEALVFVLRSANPDFFSGALRCRRDPVVPHRRARRA